MGIRKTTPFDTHLGLMSKESSDQIIYRKMALFISSCWLYFTSSLFFLFGLIAQHIFRIKMDDSSRRAMKEYSKHLEPVPESTESEESDFDSFGKEEEEISNLSFKFEYQIPEINTRSNEEPSISATEDDFLDRTTNISKYRFLSEKNFSGFIEKPEAMTFRVHESYIGFSEEKIEYKFLSEKDFEESPIESKDVILLKDQLLEEGIPGSSETNSLAKKEVAEDFSGFNSDSESMSLSDGYSVKNLAEDSDSDGFLSERDFNDTGSVIGSNRSEEEIMEDIKIFEEGQSSSSNCESSDIKKQTNYGTISDDFLHERGFDELENNSEEHPHELQSIGAKDYPFPNDNSIGNKSQLDEMWSENESSDLELEIKEWNIGEIKETELPISRGLQIEFMDSSDDEFSSFRNDHSNINSLHLADPEPKLKDLDSKAEFDSSNGNYLSNPINVLNQMDGVIERDEEGLVCEPEDLEGEKRAPEEDTLISKETQLEDLDTEDLDELESLWEHQELIEQLRMELRRVKAIGLPTILEESESPKTVEDLKPWKIDKKFSREDPMNELHKFYKSYRERMRKFDILNYQKMYAIGFLQLKDPLQSLGSQKFLIPTIMSHLSQNFRPLCRRKSTNDPSEKFIKELQNDLETVYVGQMCLSWEFLRWQYEKARELPDSDPYRSHQYNQVAGEFQQFQVIVQRFIENEPFQGPRLPNYVKKRSILRNLLQVPVIKEDCLKDKMEERRKGNGAITSEMLEDIMEESIRIFWEFVKADKDETSIILKGLLGNQVELQDPSDFKLMADVQTSLQKKDKKLKDILKTGNCLVKKFKKPREDRSNQDLFFSQVDMKLVSRVLKMSRITTDQLVWCHKKLNKITFAERKIHREPSFLLFPC